MAENISNFSTNELKVQTILSQSTPLMKASIEKLKTGSTQVQILSLKEILLVIQKAWETAVIGRDLAYSLCDTVRTTGGLEILVEQCDKGSNEVKLASAKLLEQCMTVRNRNAIAQNGIEVIIKLAKECKHDPEMIKAATGILESMFKHSEETCSVLIQNGALDSLLFYIRTSDTVILRHCAIALANLALFGGAENQSAMISKKVPEWLFPLAFSCNDSIRYYAFLAITALAANKEIELQVVQSGTLELVEPFVKSHDPMEFAESDKAHIHGQSKVWLLHLVPLLSSKRVEAQNIASFHFAMEAGIKKAKGHQVFEEIGAVKPLKKIASNINKVASKFACKALKITGEKIPYQLSSQVPLWSVEDVQHWLKLNGFEDLVAPMAANCVDGDILLQLTEENLKDDIGINNGICRKRFFRDLKSLKLAADYHSCDPSNVNAWLEQVGEEFKMYTYQMLMSGIDCETLHCLNDKQLLQDCFIKNSIHRLKILKAANDMPDSVDNGNLQEMCNKHLDCFISYRRSNGSQLASLLKVHLQLRGFTIYLDIERLQAGKFDESLLSSVKSAANFILVLTPFALDRCVGDENKNDWVHKEIVAALEGGCNIIPILDDFDWPSAESLPNDMRSLHSFNGIRWIHDYQDACIDKLELFLKGENYQKTKPTFFEKHLLHKRKKTATKSLEKCQSLDSEILSKEFSGNSSCNYMTS